MNGLSKGIHLDPRHTVLTLAYVVGIYWLSSLSDLGIRGSYPFVHLASNLFHILLYAGLALCLVKAVSKRVRGPEIPVGLFGLTFVGCAVYAASDEWHQFFVPGRVASVGDFLLDLMGIGAALLILRLRALTVIQP